jgi:hypothetical protein
MFLLIGSLQGSQETTFFGVKSNKSKVFTNCLQEIYKSLLIKLLRQAQLNTNFVCYLFSQIEVISSCEQVLPIAQFFEFFKPFF